MAAFVIKKLPNTRCFSIHHGASKLGVVLLSMRVPALTCYALCKASFYTSSVREQASGLCLVMLSKQQDGFHSLSDAAKRLQAEFQGEGTPQVHLLAWLQSLQSICMKAPFSAVCACLLLCCYLQESTSHLHLFYASCSAIAGDEASSGYRPCLPYILYSSPACLHAGSPKTWVFLSKVEGISRVHFQIQQSGHVCGALSHLR